MKVLIAAAFCLSLAGSAAALRPPTPAERFEIEMQLIEARAIETGTNGLFKKIAKLEEAERSLDRNTADIAELKLAISDLEKQRDVCRDKAIHLTLRAYDLAPTDSDGRLEMPKGEIVMPHFKGKSATWIPIAGKNTARDAIDARGNHVTIPPLSQDGRGVFFGITSYDGVTTLLDGSFASPGLLALTLLHERTHFEQFTKTGVGDKLTPGELEVNALETGQHNINAVGLTTTEKATAERILFGDPNTGDAGQLDFWREKAKHERATRRWVTPWGSGQQAPEFLPNPQAHREELQRQFDDLDDAVNAEIKETREATRRLQQPAPLPESAQDQADARERLRQAVQQPPAPEPLPPNLTAAPVDRIRLARVLGEFAGKACQAPGSLTQGDLNYFVVVAPELSGTGEISSQLSGCAKSVFDQIVALIRANRLRGALRLDFVSRLAAPPPPPLQMPRRGTGESEERRERPERCNYTYIPELHQTIRACSDG
jgi:hypothetical protein